MAHEVENMFSVRQTPWHGLGEILEDHPDDLDYAYRIAGMNYEVKTYPLFTEGGQKAPAVAIRREDTGAILGVSGPDYKVLDNWTSISWFQKFLDSGMAKLETAGVLREGKKIWVLAKVDKSDIQIVPNDDVVMYILLSNGHDGTTAVRLGFTPTRVVCANTLGWAHRSKSSSLIRLFHRGNISIALDKLRDSMNLVTGEFEATAEQYRELAKHDVSTKDLKRYVRQVFAPKEDPDDKDVAPQMVARITRLFETGRGHDLEGVSGTYWGLYNAVTEYLSYERGSNDEVRLDNLWFGQGVSLNQRALQVASKMATAVAA